MYCVAEHRSLLRPAQVVAAVFQSVPGLELSVKVTHTPSMRVPVTQASGLPVTMPPGVPPGPTQRPIASMTIVPLTVTLRGVMSPVTLPARSA